MGTPTDLTDTLLNGRFRLAEAIDSGGMGVVYRACDEQGTFDDIVVKIPKDVSDDELVACFEREARRHEKIQHESVVPVLYAGRHQSLPYFVMPFLAGGSLAKRLVRPQGLSEVLEWLPDIAAALDAIHASGALHRDVKPNNVLFNEKGRPKLADFGISKGSDTTTIGGGPRGSLNFMPPEATDGRYEPAYDQYSLAATVYFATTGYHPGHDPNDQARDGHTEWRRFWRRKRGRVKPPHELQPSLGEDVGKAILRGLRLNPEFRYPSCKALVEALRGSKEADRTPAPKRRAPAAMAMAHGASRATATLPPSTAWQNGATGSATNAPPVEDATDPHRLMAPESFAEGCFEVSLDDQPAKHAPQSPRAADDTRAWTGLAPQPPKRRVAPWLAAGLAVVLGLAVFVLWPRQMERVIVPFAASDFQPDASGVITYRERRFHVSVAGRGDLRSADLELVGGPTRRLKVTQTATDWRAFGSIEVPDGRQAVKVALVPVAGKRVTETWDLDVDATLPVLRIAKAPTVADGMAVFQVAIDEANPPDTWQVNVDGGTCAIGETGVAECRVRVSPGEQLTVRVSAKDRAGNEGALDVDVQRAAGPRDTMPPGFVGSPPQTLHVPTPGPVTLRGQVNDPQARVTVRLHGGAPMGEPVVPDRDGTFTSVVQLIEPRAYDIRFVAEDPAGNRTMQRRHIIVDGETPTARILHPLPDAVLATGTSMVIRAKVVDQWPDLAQVRVYRDDVLIEAFEATVRATHGVMPSARIAIPIPGTYRVEVRGTDRAGNASALARRIVAVR